MRFLICYTKRYNRKKNFEINDLGMCQLFRSGKEETLYYNFCKLAIDDNKFRYYEFDSFQYEIFYGAKLVCLSERPNFYTRQIIADLGVKKIEIHTTSYDESRWVYMTTICV